MVDFICDFTNYLKEYGVKHGIDSDQKCIEHAIHESVIMETSKKPAVFDWKRYIQDHPDLQIRLGKGNPVHVNDATCHYLNHGKKEKRKTYILGTNEPYVYDFDWEMYDKLNPDVFTQRHRTVGEWHCFRHWCEYGHKEGRPTGGEKLVVKNDASISTDDVVNKRWREELTQIIQTRCYNNIDELIKIEILPLESTSCVISNNKNNIVVCSHSNLSHTAGDTIMLSNWINRFMKDNNHVTLLSRHSIPTSFVRNLNSNSYTLIQCNNNNDLVIKMNELQDKTDRFFIRNHEILNELQTSSFLHKICFYGLYIHLEGISLMQNKFHSIITQSEELKTKYIEKGVLADKIEVVEPFVEKYDFDLAERNDNEIRLIYCGTLRDEENILKIIEEFQKIHKERPEVVLKIVYGKIMNNNAVFEKKVNEYIKNGVDGITFKHNLSHKDACYEIVTSDIGICWRKPGYGDNGEVSTKVKEYEMYGIECLTHTLYKCLTLLKYHNEAFISFYNDISIIFNSKIKTYIPYVLHNGMPYDNGGYAVRSHSIMNSFNSMYSDKMYIGIHKFGYPYYIYNMKTVSAYVNKIENVYYITLPNLFHYNIWLSYLTNIFGFNTFHVASAHSNASPILDFCKKNNLKSIYEVRGMWNLTRLSREVYYHKQTSRLTSNHNKEVILSYNKDLECELKAINDCSVPLFITDQLYTYCNTFRKLTASFDKNTQHLLDYNKPNILPKYPIFYNCAAATDDIIDISNTKPKYNGSIPFIIGYTGSIVYYEGIYEAIIAIEKIILETSLQIEFHIVGNLTSILTEQVKYNVANMKSVLNKPFVKFIGKVPYNQVNDYIRSFDLYIIPRLGLPVTNIVSPLKPFEPMSLKIPLLMSDCDCLNVISGNGNNCMVFKRDDEGDFMKKVIHIIKFGYPEQLLENGYNYVKQERNWTNMIKLVGLYDMLE